MKRWGAVGGGTRGEREAFRREKEMCLDLKEMYVPLTSFCSCRSVCDAFSSRADTSRNQSSLAFSSSTEDESFWNVCDLSSTHEERNLSIVPEGPSSLRSFSCEAMPGASRSMRVTTRVEWRSSSSRVSKSGSCVGSAGVESLVG